uniref:Uncharacterized protein n=1 Tax=Romanomermis culicivorax TaxID=13658 RepID=A0A915K000_ROMCU
MEVNSLYIGTGARVDISSSVNFKKSVICVAVPIKLAVAVGAGRADTMLTAAALLCSGQKSAYPKALHPRALHLSLKGAIKEFFGDEHVQQGHSRQRRLVSGDTFNPNVINLMRAIHGNAGSVSHWRWSRMANLYVGETEKLRNSMSRCVNLLFSLTAA